MKKILTLIITSLCLLSLFVFSASAAAAENVKTDYEISPEEFFTLLVDSLASDEIKEPIEKDWCNPQIRVLVNKGIVEPLDWHNFELGHYSAASFIDRAMYLVGYNSRPLDESGYIEKVKTAAVDAGLISEDYDCTKKMLKSEAFELIDTLKEKTLKKVEYTAEDAPV